MTLVNATDVSVVRSGRHLLDSISFGIDAGELLGIVGPNGAGKSTMLRVLAGDVVPDAGSTWLDGVETAGAGLGELAHLRSFVGPQSVSDIPFTAGEIVEMGRHPFEPDASEPGRDRQIVATAMERADVAHLANREMRTLSSGEQQRVSLARALAQTTPIMLLDEPTSALDVGHQEMVMSVLRDFTRNEAAVVAVLHDLNLAAAYADHIMLLHEGTVVALGLAREVLTEEILSPVYERPMRVIEHPFRNCPLVLTAD